MSFYVKTTLPAKMSISLVDHREKRLFEAGWTILNYSYFELEGVLIKKNQKKFQRRPGLIFAFSVLWIID